MITVNTMNPSDESGVIVITLRMDDYESGVILFMSKDDYDNRIEQEKEDFKQSIKKLKSPN